MNYTDKRLEKHTKEVIIEQIDICLSGQDPRYELGRYVEKLREEIIQQSIAEDRERVRELFVKLPYMGMIGVSELASGYRKGRADLQKQINDLLNKPLTNNKNI